MFIIDTKHFDHGSLWVSVLKQESFVSYVENEIKTTIIKNLRPTAPN